MVTDLAPGQLQFVTILVNSPPAETGGLLTRRKGMMPRTRAAPGLRRKGCANPPFCRMGGCHSAGSRGGACRPPIPLLGGEPRIFSPYGAETYQIRPSAGMVTHGAPWSFPGVTKKKSRPGGRLFNTAVAFVLLTSWIIAWKKEDATEKSPPDPLPPCLMRGRLDPAFFGVSRRLRR